jgi:nicotinamidase/pyrazinamidase
MHKALLLVDLQNDFCATGSLAVQDADAIIPLANTLMGRFEYIIASQDYHPLQHKSFAANHPGKNVGDVILWQGQDQMLWPVHCVQNTAGAAFHPGLNARKIQHIIYKGQDPNIDSYSAFYDNKYLRATGLDQYLLEKKISKLFVMGLATDYCVKYTCLDAIKLGYEVYVILDACRGVNLQTNDVAQALNEMEQAGVILLNSLG